MQNLGIGSATALNLCSGRPRLKICEGGGPYLDGKGSLLDYFDGRATVLEESTRREMV